MTEENAKTKNGLIARCFHIYGEEGVVERQGIVRNYLGDGRYLVQFFSWLTGDATTLAIYHITEMRPGKKEGCWQFYQNLSQMRDWFERQETARKGTK